jgi:hypothetical protein
MRLHSTNFELVIKVPDRRALGIEVEQTTGGPPGQPKI